MPNVVQFLVRLSPKCMKMLAALAQEREMTRTAVVRDLIQKEFKELERERKSTSAS